MVKHQDLIEMAEEMARRLRAASTEPDPEAAWKLWESVLVLALPFYTQVSAMTVAKFHEWWDEARARLAATKKDSS